MSSNTDRLLHLPEYANEQPKIDKLYNDLNQRCQYKFGNRDFYEDTFWNEKITYNKSNVKWQRNKWISKDSFTKVNLDFYSNEINESVTNDSSFNIHWLTGVEFWVLFDDKIQNKIIDCFKAYNNGILRNKNDSIKKQFNEF